MVVFYELFCVFCHVVEGLNGIALRHVEIRPVIVVNMLNRSHVSDIWLILVLVLIHDSERSDCGKIGLLDRITLDGDLSQTVW